MYVVIQMQVSWVYIKISKQITDDIIYVFKLVDVNCLNIFNTDFLSWVIFTLTTNAERLYFKHVFQALKQNFKIHLVIFNH